MKEDTIPETIDQIEDLELEREVECIDFEIGDHVVYPRCASTSRSRSSTTT
jgi:hypothetical protein